jgi:hypothetical protein
VLIFFFSFPILGRIKGIERTLYGFGANQIAFSKKHISSIFQLFIV